MRWLAVHGVDETGDGDPRMEGGDRHDKGRSHRLNLLAERR